MNIGCYWFLVSLFVINNISHLRVSVHLNTADLTTANDTISRGAGSVDAADGTWSGVGPVTAAAAAAGSSSTRKRPDDGAGHIGAAAAPDTGSGEGQK